MDNSFHHEKEKRKETIVAFFLLAIVWSIGASNIYKNSKEKFNNYFQNLCNNSIKKYPKFNLDYFNYIFYSFNIYDIFKGHMI